MRWSDNVDLLLRVCVIAHGGPTLGWARRRELACVVARSFTRTHTRTVLETASRCALQPPSCVGVCVCGLCLLASRTHARPVGTRVRLAGGLHMCVRREVRR